MWPGYCNKEDMPEGVDTKSGDPDVGGAQAQPKQKGVWPGFEYFKINRKEKKVTQADGTGALPQFLRAEVRQAKGISFRAAFKEYDASPTPETNTQKGVGRFKVIMLQEGLGNFKDAYYYTKEALQSATTIFEGKKVYIDHPSAEEDIIRPERTIRDIAGHFENVRVEESVDDNGIHNGRMELVADLIPIAGFAYGWIRDIFGHSLAYAKKYIEHDFIGLSINATGESEEVDLRAFLKSYDIPNLALPKIIEAEEKGVETIRVVNTITDAVSCDIVTEAGAGGKILDLIEKEKRMAKDTNREAHDDEGQDKKLIKSMIKKHLGGYSDDKDMERATEMFQAYHDMGYKPEKAAEYAAHGSLMSKHVSSKMPVQSAEADEKKEDENEKKEAEGSETEAEKKEDEKCEAEGDEKKEADEKEEEDEKKKEAYVRLSGENAALRTRIEQLEKSALLSKILEESNLPESACTLFKERASKCRTAREIQGQWAIFKESFDHAISLQKTGATPEKFSYQTGGGDISFSDCVRN